MKIMSAKICLSLFLLSLGAAAFADSTLVAVSDPNVVNGLSPLNWVVKSDFIGSSVCDVGNFTYESADGSHPTVAGHRTIYDKVLPAFEKIIPQSTDKPSKINMDDGNKMVAAALAAAQPLPGAEGEVVTNSIGLKLKLIPAGSFQMGSPDSEKDHSANEGPVHKVTISKPFYLGVYVVTQEEWETVMAGNPSSSKGAKKPVTDVSWNDAHEFIRKLSAKEKVEYRLPTEAEWEYACRAGTTTAFYWGDRFDARYAWANQNSGGATHDVGTLQPNAWGLFDISGNVWEWCEDRFANYAGVGELTDPKGASTGESRVLRGGSWGSFTRNSRAACRDHSAPPTTRDSRLGFRLARTK